MTLAPALAPRPSRPRSLHRAVLIVHEVEAWGGFFSLSRLYKTRERVPYPPYKYGGDRSAAEVRRWCARLHKVPRPFTRHSDTLSLALGSPRSLFIGTEPQPPHVHIREVKDRIELRQRHALHGEAHLVRVGVRVRGR